MTHWFAQTNQIARSDSHQSDSEEISSLSSYIVEHPATSFFTVASVAVTCVKWTPGPSQGRHLPALSCSCHARPHVANKQTCPYRWNSIKQGSQSPDSLAAPTANYKANVMASAVLRHTEIVNYTEGLMVEHVPRMQPLCFMMTTVKTGSALKSSESWPPSLHFYHVQSKRRQESESVAPQINLLLLSGLLLSAVNMTTDLVNRVAL